MTEQQLKHILRTHLPQAPESAWFVRKVMNRLPDESRSLYTRAEKVSYIVAALFLIGFLVWFVRGVRLSGCITAGDLITGGAAVIAIICLGVSYAAPLFWRWLREP